MRKYALCELVIQMGDFERITKFELQSLQEMLSKYQFGSFRFPSVALSEKERTTLSRNT